MTVDGIRLGDIGSIRKIEVTKNINHHSVCDIEILLLNCDNIIKKLQNMIGKKVRIKDEESLDILMYGQVEKIKGNLVFPDSIAVIEVVSHSRQLDSDKYNRVFQNTKKTYKEIMDILSTSNVMFEIVNENFSNQVEERVLVQNEETNFDFVINLAEVCGYNVFVDDIDEKCTIYIGKSITSKFQVINSSEILSMNYSISAKEKILEIESREFINFGSCVAISGNDGWEDEDEDLVVVGMKILYENGEIKYSYKLLQEYRVEETHELGAFFIGIAKVIENKDPEHLGRIQVAFEDFEDSMPDNRIWVNYIPLLTEKDRGVVLLPDIDEFVHVFVENGQCFADGCIRRMPLNEQQRNIEERSIYVRDKALVMNNDRLSLRNDEMSIDMTRNVITAGDSGIKIELNSNGNEANMLLTAKSEIKLESGKMDLAARENVAIKTKRVDIDTNRMNINGK